MNKIQAKMLAARAAQFNDGFLIIQNASQETRDEFFISSLTYKIFYFVPSFVRVYPTCLYVICVFIVLVN